MYISMIAAMDNNNAIGTNGKMPWHIPKDFQWFKEKTLGHTILMGRKCYEDIIQYSKGKPLPQRTNVILTSQNITTHPDFIVIHSIDDFMTKFQDNQKVFIVGGGEIYSHFLPYADELILTRVNTVIKEPTTYFPQFNINDYEKTFEKLENDSQFDFIFEIYKKK